MDWIAGQQLPDSFDLSFDEGIIGHSFMRECRVFLKDYTAWVQWLGIILGRTVRPSLYSDRTVFFFRILRELVSQGPHGYVEPQKNG